MPAADGTEPTVSTEPLHVYRYGLGNSGSLVNWDGQTTTDGVTTTTYTFQIAPSPSGPWSSPTYDTDAGGTGQCLADMPIAHIVSATNPPSADCVLLHAGAGITPPETRYVRVIAHGGDEVAETGPVTALTFN